MRQHSVHLALALALLTTAATAQFDAYDWNLSGCADVVGDSLILETCITPCAADISYATMLAPPRGTYSMTMDWFADHECCVAFYISRLVSPGNPHAILSSFGDSWGPDWCEGVDPCTGTAGTLWIYTEGEQDLQLKLNAFETGCFFGLKGDTRVVLSRLMFTPELLPPMLTSASGTPAYAQTGVYLNGQLLEAPVRVQLEGLGVGPTTADHPIWVDIDSVSLGDPGFYDVKVTTPGGSTTLTDGLRLWPTLTATVNGSGIALELDSQAHMVPYVLVAGLGSLGAPVAFGPDIYHGLWIDLTRPWIIFETGTTQGFDPLVTSFPMPGDPSVQGLELYFQGLAGASFFYTGHPYQYSFTNLASITIG